MTTPSLRDAAQALKPCPFCGAGETMLHVNKGTWNGQRYGEPVSVEVRHWCEPEDGQPARMVARVGRDEESAIAAWNRRAALAAPADALAEPVAWRWKPSHIFNETVVTDDKVKAESARHYGMQVEDLYTSPPATQLRQAVARALAEQREHIAQGWDGCMCDAVGETLDVGAEIRRGGQQ